MATASLCISKEMHKRHRLVLFRTVKTTGTLLFAGLANAVLELTSRGITCVVTYMNCPSCQDKAGILAAGDVSVSAEKLRQSIDGA